MSQLAPDNRRWTPRPRFSLRILFVAFSLVVIGFPIWYRWPYERLELLSAAGATPKIERTTTWQRQWGGRILKHGPERRLVNGQLSELTNYALGQKHGYYVHHDATGKAEVWGQYVHGEKDATWVEKDAGITRTATWRQGKLDGTYTIALANGQKSELLFVDGRLTHFNGRPAVNRLYDLLEAGSLDPALAKALRSPTSIGGRGIGLNRALQMLRTTHGISIVVDRRVVMVTDIHNVEAIDGADLCSVVTMLTAPHGLGCDLRHGSVWITPAPAVENWHDQTGVSTLRQAKNRALERVWNYRFDVVEARPRPLAEVLEEFAVPLKLYIDTTKLPPTDSKDHPLVPPILLEKERLETVLAILCEHTGARCQATAEALIILPPLANPHVRDGHYVVCYNGRGLALHYVRGVLTHVNGRPIRRLDLENVDPKLAAALRQVMSLPMEFVQTPLRDALQFLEDAHGVPIQLEPSLRKSRLVLTINLRQVDLETALRLLAASVGMECTYRYGTLWLARAGDDVGWTDPTGVSEIVPPPDSTLSQVWNKSTQLPVEYVETPLTDAMTFLQDSLRVKFDTSRLNIDAQRGKVLRTTFHGRNRALRHVLGAILYETGCTCRLDGETIVILPPKSS